MAKRLIGGAPVSSLSVSVALARADGARMYFVRDVGGPRPLHVSYGRKRDLSIIILFFFCERNERRIPRFAAEGLSHAATDASDSNQNFQEVCDAIDNHKSYIKKLLAKASHVSADAKDLIQKCEEERGE